MNGFNLKISSDVTGEKRIKIIITAIVTAIMVMGIMFVVGLLLIKFLWAWTIPDLFPGAVQQGLIAKSISWITAAKLALFISILAGIARGSSKEEKVQEKVIE